jgi:hypothetical protein
MLLVAILPEFSQKEGAAPKVRWLAPKVGALPPKVGALPPKVGALPPKVGALAPKVGSSQKKKRFFVGRVHRHAACVQDLIERAWKYFCENPQFDLRILKVPYASLRAITQ